MISAEPARREAEVCEELAREREHARRLRALIRREQRTLRTLRHRPLVRFARALQQPRASLRRGAKVLVVRSDSDRGFLGHSVRRVVGAHRHPPGQVVVDTGKPVVHTSARPSGDPGADIGSLPGCTASLGRAALDREKASSAHLRSIARHERRKLEALSRMPLVQAAIAIERTMGRPGSLASRTLRWWRRTTTGSRLVAQALLQGTDRTTRRRHLELFRAQMGRPPALDRRISVILLPTQRDIRGNHPFPRLPLGVETIAVEHAEHTGVASPATASTRMYPGESLTEAVDGAVRASNSDVLCLVASSAEPLDDRWWARLAAELRDDVVAASAVLIHPERPLGHATPHDLLVRERGLDLEALHDGTPVLRSRAAGTLLTPDLPEPVDAVSPVCLAIDRAAYESVGGLCRGLALQAAMVDLCVRLRSRGGRVLVVPQAPALDHRPARSREALQTPVPDGHASWRDLVETHGPTLTGRRRAGIDGLRLTISTPVPSRHAAERWGDWHLAEALGRSLERMGHSTRIQTADQTDDLAGRACDVHLVLRGIEPVRRTPGQHHVLWIISHPELVDPAECDEADLVLVASHRFAEDLRPRTTTPVEVLMQATDHRRFHPRPADPHHAHDVTVVANARRVLRPMVEDVLAIGLQPAIYGAGWGGLVDPELIVTSHVPNHRLPTVYSSAGVVMNDHWSTMRSWGFVSNRLFDAAACAAPIVSEHMREIPQIFGDTVRTYGTRTELAAHIDELLGDPDRARVHAQEAHELVFSEHTFDSRARQLLAHLEEL